MMRMQLHWAPRPGGSLPGIVLLLLVAGPLIAEGPPAPPPARRPPEQRDLFAKELAGSNFRGADLRQANIVMTDLRGADLHGADLTGAKMDRARLEGADLSDAVGLGTADFGFGIDARRANIQRADLRDARAIGAFDDADFRGANLSGAFLHGRFYGARFDGADVHDAVLLGAVGSKPLHEDLRQRGALVTASDLVRAIRAGRDFTGAPLRDFELASSELDMAPFEGADLREANLEGASLRQARCAGSWICFANLQAANLSGADLTGAHLNGAKLRGANLSSAKCRGAELPGADLRGTKWVGADLTYADLRHADLTGADLTGAILLGAKWDAAIIADVGGVTPEKQAALKTQAARWKYDLDLAIHDIERNFSLPVWLITCVVGGLVLCSGHRRAPGHPALWVLTGLHGVALLPAVAFLFLILTCTAPTAQLSGNMDGWSAWFHLWPLFIGLSYLALAAFLPAVVVAWVACFRRPVAGLKSCLAAATVLTGLALLASLGTLFLLAPDA
jgi:uncharacterized protein YjbI with pentapeptide repeats